MRIIVVYFLCLFAILVLTSSVNSQSPCSVSAASNVRIHTQLLDRKSIESGDDEVSIMELRLKLTFSNVGKTPILIFRGWVSASHFWISKSEAEARKKEFEVNSSVSVLTDETGAEPAFSIDEFATISGDQRYSTELAIRIPFLRDRVTPGIHVLMFKIETWRWFDEISEKKTQSLKSVGQLLTVPVVSEPMIFRIN